MENMECDTDEDVLFENSPLHQHLVETGVENLTTEKIVASNTERERKNRGNVLSLQRGAIKSSAVNKCFQCFLNLATLLFGINRVKVEVNQIKLFYKRRVLDSSVKCRVLEEEDKNFLEHFSGLNQVTDPGKQDPALGSKINLMLCIPLLSSYFFGRLMWPDYSFQYKQITDAMSIITSVYFLYLIGKALYLAWCKWTLERLDQEVTQLLTCGEEFFRGTGKCLRLIQESELVARGFTLISQRSPLCRLEQNGMLGYQRQCPQLRHQLFIMCRDCMIASKDWTSQLVTQHPLPVDSSINFLAHIPLEEYGPCLQVEGDNSVSLARLEEVTDGFSISAIKGINHVCRMQYSEFCRCVILRVLQAVDSPSIAVHPETQGILEKVLGWIQKLGTLHSYYSSVTTLSDTQPQKSDLSQMNDLDIAVHSLDLHLQAALLRVRKLSVLIKHSANQNTEIEQDTINNQSQEALWDQIKQELLACKGCWEEGLERLNKLYKNHSCQERTEEVPPQTEHTQTPIHVPPVDLFNTSPPIIEDEVFEAYIDEEAENDPDYSWDEYLTPEEKERKRQEKQEALRLLTELKSVISVRAREMGRREKIAQERKYGHATTENHSEGIAQERKNGHTTTENHSEQRKDVTTEDQKVHVGQKLIERIYENEDSHEDTNLDLSCVSGNEGVPIHEELCHEEDLSCDECKLAVEQLKSVESESDLDCGLNTDTENDNHCKERIFTTGSEESVDCSLGSFPNSVPRIGVLTTQSPNFQFSSSLAAMAVARSRDFGLTEDTFGDSESDSEIQVTED
ncbi:vezatin-like [Saccostrea echinata]|uniref:vezatin-like n=1 Tax=Saccostrea echinata TaxID=191078 RepID=UPI002A80BBDB|nr:vezatin-like [Saccostrea echinata]